MTVQRRKLVRAASCCLLLTLACWGSHHVAPALLAAGAGTLEPRMIPPADSSSVPVFTIERIETDIKEKTVTLYFSDTFNYGSLKNSLQVVPPVRIRWYRSSMPDVTTVKLSGEFQPGQSYLIKMAPGFKSDVGLDYTRTANTFTMPDYDPAIHIGGHGTVIELKSRQLLHARLLNVDEILVKTVRIPPLLLPFAAATESERDTESATLFLYDLTVRLDRIKEAAGDHAAFVPFLGEMKHKEQLLFNRAEKNDERVFSIPLTFREDKEEGSIELVRISNNRKDQPALSTLTLYRVTDIGLAYKLSSGKLLIWATSLHDGKPLEGVSLAAFTKETEACLLGQTDKEGVLLIEEGEVLQTLSLGSLGLSAVTERNWTSRASP